MTASNELCLALKIFNFYIEYQVAAHLLKSWWRTLSFLQDFKRHSNLRHFFTDRVLPECIAIFPVNLDAVFIRLGNFNPKLVRSLVIVFIDRCDDAVSAFERVRHPPCERRFRVDSMAGPPRTQRPLWGSTLSGRLSVPMRLSHPSIQRIVASLSSSVASDDSSLG